ALYLFPRACHRGKSPQNEPSRKQETVSITHWTDRTELFLEYAPLVAGKPSRFAIHLTNLSGFKPVKEGSVEVELSRTDRRVAKFVSEGPSRPGIFGVDVSVKEPGHYNFSVQLRSASLNDVHDLEPLKVYANDKEATSTLSHTNEETVAFLKEQQWTLDFATETVAEQMVRSSLRVAATIEPHTGGVAEVTVPFA